MLLLVGHFRDYFHQEGYNVTNLVHANDAFRLRMNSEVNFLHLGEWFATPHYAADYANSAREIGISPENETGCALVNATVRNAEPAPVLPSPAGKAHTAIPVARHVGRRSRDERSKTR